MIWDQVVGHASAKETLMRAVEQDRLSHAYLFTGPSAVGKFIVARAFAAAMLCEENGCGVCNTCRRVMEEKHPDVTVLRPAGKNIPVEAVRETRLEAYRQRVEGSHRVFIVKNAERMWEEGASTLLKVLEEPPANVVFILVTASPGALLPTILSRCQQVRFFNIPVEELKGYLVENRDLSPERADLVVRLTGGVLGRALDWCDEPWRLARRDNTIKAARSLRRADLNQTLDMAQELYREIRAPVEELGSAYKEKKKQLDDGSLDSQSVKKMGKELDEESKREQIKEEIRGVKEVLSMLSWWYRDILVWGETRNSGLLVNRDLEQEVADDSEAIPVISVLKCLDVIEEGIKAAERNIPPQLNLESTLMGIQEAVNA